MPQGKSIIRNYLSGDDEVLTSLWNFAYASYVGFVPRSPGYWHWCIRKRPGVSPQDILILQENKNILGYGVLGPRGKVLELAIDPRIAKRKRGKTAAFLIKALEERSRIRGDEMIQFVLPNIDEPISRVLRCLDYRDTPGQIFHVAIIDLASLLERLLRHRRKRIPKTWGPVFVLEVKPASNQLTTYHRLIIKLNPSIVVEVDPVNAQADFTVTTDLSTLTEIIFQQTSLKEAIISGRISIFPEKGKKYLKVLMELIILNRPWYIPPADVW